MQERAAWPNWLAGLDARQDARRGASIPDGFAVSATPGRAIASG
jgi:hypothetical protein